MDSTNGLNATAKQIFQSMVDRAQSLKVEPITLDCGAHVLDCGVNVDGGLAAGIEFAKLCLAGHASVSLTTGDRSTWAGGWVQIETDHPVEACMFGQYAGWPVKHEKFFAMGSGPMRVQRGKEEILQHLSASDSTSTAVGTLECDTIPSCDVARMMADECGVAIDELYIAVAPTRSIAGCTQVVARSVETALHKMHELGFDLRCVRSALGMAPLPPQTPDFAKGIGRTNDAILYGATVNLWLDADDEQIAELGPKIPSSASSDYGAPFADIFKRCEFDFYKIDPALFSPAEVLIMNAKSGRSWRFGNPRPDLVATSFGLESAE